jgi:hypothetical protein
MTEASVPVESRVARAQGRARTNDGVLAGPPGALTILSRLVLGGIVNPRLRAQ